MTERVTCAECGNQYDSEAHPFCTRCGALEKAVVHDGPHPAVHLAARRDPRRRRVQAAGVMLLSIGAITGILFLVTAAMAPSLVPQTMDAFADQPGGDMRVHAMDGDQPVPGANVTIHSLQGEMLANGTTDQEGWANFTALSHAGVNVSVAYDGHGWHRNVLSMEGVHEGRGAQVVHADMATSGASSWQGVDAFVTGSRVVALVFAAISAVTVAGGVAALRLRRRQLAMAGAIVGGLPWIVLFAASLSVAVLFVVLVFLAAAWFVQTGRGAFTD